MLSAPSLYMHVSVLGIKAVETAQSLVCLLGDFDGALSVLTEMAYFIQERGSKDRESDLTEPALQGPYRDVFAKCEVSRVLLLMLLQPTPQRIRPEHSQILEKYAWETNLHSSPVEYLSEDLFFLLQSVVMACQSNDLDALRELEKDLWPWLDVEQKHLVHLVVMKRAAPDSELGK